MAQHSAKGGYGVQIGVRLIELSTQPDGAWQIQTRIALDNGTVVHPAILGQGRR